MTLLRFGTQTQPPRGVPASLLFGRTEKMKLVRQKLESVSRTDNPVLIQGESGTGKELCVRLLHELSDLDTESLVKVTCPAIPHSLLETELFGYEKGAFTGALTSKRGRVEQAAGGTLFLDEVGSLDVGMQAKMLQVLQDGTFSRVGGHDVMRIKTRLVSVANRDLREQVAEGSFRLDFLYRINAITIELPPLRERTKDLPELVDHFLDQYARAFNRKPEPLSRSVMRDMAGYAWPGNIRQLENMIRSYVLIGSEEVMMAELVPEETVGNGNPLQGIDLSSPISLKLVMKQATQELENRVLLEVLKANGWNRQKTAKWLNISYRSLLAKLSEMNSRVPIQGRRPVQPVRSSHPSTEQRLN